MRQRRNLTLAAVLLLCAVLAGALPSAAADKTIGVIMTGNIPYYQDIHKSFIETLAMDPLFQKGKLDIILQTPSAEPMAWTNVARKFASIGVDVIVAYGTPATLTVLKEAEGIPVVYAGVYDAAAAGITGKNVTGINSKVTMATLVKTLKEISNFTKLGIFYDTHEKDTLLQANDIKALEGKFGFTALFFDIDKKGYGAKAKEVEAMVMTTSCAAMTCVDNIVLVAREAKIPTATILGGGENRGVILTLTADAGEQGAEAAKMVLQVLGGKKPPAIPEVSPKRINMIINLKEANQLGLKVPFDLLSSATKVIK